VIVLDTHVLVWFAIDDGRLEPQAAKRIQKALRDGSPAVSAFSFWEIALLAESGRLRVGDSPEVFRTATLEAGVDEIALDGRIAILATRLSSRHGDPADRIIVATALDRSATLVMADAKILAMKAGPSRLDAQS
jgi:PIN domain nuclease of toxin-antitoxin system